MMGCWCIGIKSILLKYFDDILKLLSRVSIYIIEEKLKLLKNTLNLKKFYTFIPYFCTFEDFLVISLKGN